MKTSKQAVKVRANPIAWYRSMRIRLSLVSGTLVFVCVLLMSIFSAWRTLETETAFAAQRLQGTAAVMSVSVSSAVQIADKAGTDRILSAIRNIDNVQFGLVTDREGKSFARSGSSVFLTNNVEAMTTINAKTLFERDTFWVSENIIYAGVAVGQLHLLADLSGLRGLFFSSLLADIALAFFVSVLTAACVSVVINRMTKPITSLTKLMASVGQSGIYDRRARLDRKDEVGALAVAFNGMLDQIQIRDRDLTDYRLHLEDKVEQRTAELLSATEAAQAANVAKSEFLATMSHEIRTPMNGMMVMAEMLTVSPLAERQRRYAQIIHRSGRNLLAIINDILDLSKIEAGGVELETIAFSIDELLSDTVSLFSEKARERDLDILLRVAPEVPLTLMGDPTRVSQIVTNLVNNALKFTQKGGVEVCVGYAEQAQGAPMLTIGVRDTGIGIAKDKQASIFEAFTQAEQSTTREYGGTGLGLSICVKLAAAMGGRLQVESEPGNGSTFTFTAPFEPGSGEAYLAPLENQRLVVLSKSAFISQSMDAAFISAGAHVIQGTVVDKLERLETDDQIVVFADSSVVNDPAITSQLAGLKSHLILLVRSMVHEIVFEGRQPDAILPIAMTRAMLTKIGAALDNDDISVLESQNHLENSAPPLPRFEQLAVLAVDDNAVNREVINEALMALGVKADFAENGLDAIKRAKTKAYDVVLMDCSMPGMDGYEATRLIRTDEEGSDHRAFIAALTAHVSGAHSTAFSEAGMDAYLTKPFVINDICAVLSSASEQSNMSKPKTKDDSDTKASSQQANPQQAPSLLSESSVAMFDQLGASNGGTMKRKIFGMFSHHATQALSALRQAVEQKAPYNEIGNLAHALKSMCASSGAQAAQIAAQRLEDMAHERAVIQICDLDALAELVAQTDHAMQAVLVQETATQPNTASQA